MAGFLPRGTALSAESLSKVGGTRLVEFRGLSRPFPGVRILGKAEWENPSGSVKDRAALRMLEEAVSNGDLRAGMTVVDATSGNTGIAYAWIGGAMGYRVRLFVPANAGGIRKRMLRSLGADVVYTDPLAGIDGAIALAREEFERDPVSTFYPNQYANDANWRAHYDGTAPEIWRETARGVTHFVAGLGTSGTFVGTSRRLKELGRVCCISVEPDEPLHGLEGLKHMDSVHKPAIYDDRLADERMLVRTEDAYAVARSLRSIDNISVGPSAAAALAACVRVAERVPAGSRATIVTILPDGGERYEGEHFWNE